ncbi:hypothetical protein [Candidatus Poriferisocius sp.]|uniref:hypothetical protein n=1 Tax=Candidatus Poriferisocius sp. TaxID=3101276 RepID=UPI003B5C879E
MDPALQELSVLLSEAAVRNAAATVADRISAAKARKRDKETIAALEDIVNELLADKSELVRIAQAFDDELVAQRLSSDDVNFITENLLPLIRQLMEVSDQDVLEPQMLDALKSILAAETLTIMQLIGFNYRQAIGKPLTELAAAAITSRMPQDQTQSLDLQQALVERDIALAELAGDPEAWARFVELRPRGTQ